MRNRYDVVPFTQNYLESAVKLFVEGYRQERDSSPLLPSKVIDEPEWIHRTLKSFLANPGVAVLHEDQLVAFMLTGFQLPFKGQKAVSVPEYCHSSILSDKEELYQIMYMHLADEWANNHTHLHIVAHFSHDTLLQISLYRLGFGAIVAEELRDFSEIHGVREVDIVEEADVGRLLDIDIEHSHYYRNAPIFILKSIERGEHLTAIESAARQGDTFFVYYENNEPCAYLRVGELATEGEGFLLRGTNTAQIKSAYARQHVRRTGIGKALLQRAMDWSKEHGHERLFVEHETANYYGGNFWSSYFTPYLYASIRYIDNAI
jgi:GNAT superfamily N-acetyltransferase